jgi:hypothetical protein
MVPTIRVALLFSAFLLHAWTSPFASASYHSLWSYKSRPDINAPRWKIRVHNESALAPGRWFVAPYVTGTRPEVAVKYGWSGPAIYDQDGSLVWSSTPLVDDDWIGRVEAFTLSDVDLGEGDGVESMMSLMSNRHGDAVIIDNHYQVRKHKDAKGPGAFNSHELNFVENGTKALIVYTHYGYEISEAESSAIGFDGKCKIACNGIAEYDVKTWERTWTWSSCKGDFGEGYIAADESTLRTEDMTGKCTHNWDYVHANSVDKTPEGDYLFSCRHADGLYKISKDDGRIIWRLGGTKSDFVQFDDFRFTRQHHIRHRGSNGTHTFISILDNAAGIHKTQAASHPFSRGMVIALNENSSPMTAGIVHHYDHPDGNGGLADRRGNCQLLPNGNVFMGWSERALQSEHSEDGTLLMDARLEARWLGSYRAFKFDGFVGAPLDPPDAVATAIISYWGNKTQVYVSWNGATEVTQWRLFESTRSGKQREMLSTVPKHGFETNIEYPGFPRYIVVEALAGNDSVLASTDVVEVLTVQSITMSSLFFPVAIATGVAVAVILTLAAFYTMSQCRARSGRWAGVMDLFTRRRYQPLDDGMEEGSVPLMESDFEDAEETGRLSKEIEVQHCDSSRIR